MMTRLKLNVYRAEDEFITMQKIEWRKEENERRKELKKVEKEMKSLRAKQNKEWRERREEKRKEDEMSRSSARSLEDQRGQVDTEEALRQELRWVRL